MVRALKSWNAWFDGSLIFSHKELVGSYSCLNAICGEFLIHASYFVRLVYLWMDRLEFQGLGPTLVSNGLIALSILGPS
ncbi:hypothetical protein SLEP1_g9344 [Rubroshorea leprosula]|nr:hypothetical protein SLEP1_g9344 [Rubroshorea leprosula]